MKDQESSIRFRLPKKLREKAESAVTDYNANDPANPISLSDISRAALEEYFARRDGRADAGGMSAADVPAIKAATLDLLAKIEALEAGSGRANSTPTSSPFIQKQLARAVQKAKKTKSSVPRSTPIVQAPKPSVRE